MPDDNDTTNRKKIDPQLRNEERELRIVAFGHNQAEFPTRDALVEFMERDLVERHHNRYHYTQPRNAEIIILSYGGFAVGHFVIDHRERPNAQDMIEFSLTKWTYIVSQRVIYAAPVELFPLGIKVGKYGAPVSASQFDQIKKLAGGVREA